MHLIRISLPLIIILLLLTFYVINKVNPGHFKEQNSFNKQNLLKEFHNTPHSKLSKMTLREKIAQMIISSVVPENVLNASSELRRLERLCTESKVGGFIFFKGTARDYTTLANKLQDFSETPLLISADFERGTAMRVTGGSLFPNNMAIGAANDTDLTYEMGLTIAGEMRRLGVHQNYAPVCDVNNNSNNPIINVRSFGEDPELVGRLSSVMIKGLQDGNVIATAKHFPGHGDTEIDSHKDLPVLNFDMERLNRIELIPFKNALNSSVMSVMTAHLSLPQLEPQLNVPSSLSKNIITGLLKSQMGFYGLIITDALNMKGITKYFSVEEVAVMCVEAGNDLILMPLDENRSINAIEKAVYDGKINEDRIDSSVNKILQAKEWLGLFENKYVNETEAVNNINSEDAKNLAQLIADRSVTLVKDDNNILPFKNPDKKYTIYNISDGIENINSSYFNEKIPDKFNNIRIFNITEDIDKEKADYLINESFSYDYVIIAIYAKVKYGTGKINLLPSHSELIEKLNSLHKFLVIISFGNPYLLKEFPSVPAYIAAYGDQNVSINATLKVITGEIPFKGKLPVTINDQYKIGTGILR
jgi:beta-N-acetylhexosaminidase